MDTDIKETDMLKLQDKIEQDGIVIRALEQDPDEFFETLPEELHDKGILSGPSLQDFGEMGIIKNVEHGEYDAYLVFDFDLDSDKPSEEPDFIDLQVLLRAVLESQGGIEYISNYVGVKDE